MSTCRSVQTTSILLVLITVLLSGCGSTAGTSTPTVSLSPDGVVIVNGKEFTKTDLADELTGLQMLKPEDRKNSGFAAEIPKPGTPEYAELETGLVRSIIWHEIHIQEAARRGLSTNDAELKAQLDDCIKYYGGEAAFNQILTENNKTLDWEKEQLKDAVLIQKVQEAVDREAPAGADEIETELNRNDAYWTWFTNLKLQSDIVYADQYRPAAPDTHSSAWLAQTLFINRYYAWVDYEEKLHSQEDELWKASQSYAGVQAMAVPIIQNIEKMQADMAAKSQDLTGEPRKIADQIVQAVREYIDTEQKQLAAGEANDMDTWKSLNEDVFASLNLRLSDLLAQWDAARI